MATIERKPLPPPNSTAVPITEADGAEIIARANDVMDHYLNGPGSYWDGGPRKPLQETIDDLHRFKGTRWSINPRLVRTLPVFGFDAGAPATADRPKFFSDRLDKMTAFPEDEVTSGYSNPPLLPSQTSSPLSTFSGRPVPRLTTPLPLGLLHDASASSNGDWPPLS